MDFDWRDITPGGPLVRLYYGGSEVARLCARINGTWYAALNQHLQFTDRRRRDRDCSSYEAGREGLEQWLVKNEARVARELAAFAAVRGKDRA